MSSQIADIYALDTLHASSLKSIHPMVAYLGGLMKSFASEGVSFKFRLEGPSKLPSIGIGLFHPLMTHHAGLAYKNNGSVHPFMEAMFRFDDGDLSLFQRANFGPNREDAKLQISEAFGCPFYPYWGQERVQVFRNRGQNPSVELGYDSGLAGALGAAGYMHTKEIVDSPDRFGFEQRVAAYLQHMYPRLLIPASTPISN